MNVKHLLFATCMLFATITGKAQNALSLPYAVDWDDDQPDGWAVLHQPDTVCASAQFNVSISFSPCTGHKIDDWVTSPALDLSATSKLNFTYATFQQNNINKAGDTLQCWLLDDIAKTKHLLAGFRTGDSTFGHHDTTLLVPATSKQAYIAYRYTNSTDPDFYANIIKVRISAIPTGISSVKTALNKIELYPNPANNNINWQTSGTIMPGTICAIIDLTGRVLQTVDAGAGKTNISTLPKGNYIFRMGEASVLFVKE